MEEFEGYILVPFNDVRVEPQTWPFRPSEIRFRNLEAVEKTIEMLEKLKLQYEEGDI